MKKSREELCEVLCGKRGCPKNIFDCNGKMIGRCREINKSFINDLNYNQVKYITSSLNEDIFLKACPGSGKTEVLGIKSAYESIRWQRKYQGIAILTFTNSAENEIRNRIEVFLNETLKYPHYIGTFTSWIHGYLANPFLSKVTNYTGNGERDKSIRLIESTSNSDFLNAFSSKYGYSELGNVKAHEYYREFKTDDFIYCGNRSNNGQQILQQLLDENSWRYEDLEKIKKKFWKSGFYLYEDVEYLIYLLLNENDKIAKFLALRFPVIFIDECQDLSYVQLDIIRLLYEVGCKIHLIGDLDQAIYAFRNIDPNDTLEFIDKLKLNEMTLNENYRSCQKIVDISNFIINRNSDIVGCIDQKLKDALVVLLYKKDKERDAIKVFSNLIKENNLCVEKSRVIVRNNTLKNKLLGLKNQARSNNILEDLAKAIYLSINGKKISEFKISFLLFAKAIQMIYFKDCEHLNSNYFYKPSELEMSEWKETISIIKKLLISESSLLDFSKNWTEWKKILGKIMKRSVNDLPNLRERECNLGRIRSDNARKTIEEVLFHNTNQIMEYTIETIHGCKGMSLDAVLFLSSYQQVGNSKESGSYWRQWFDRTVIEEKNRLAYVAFTRAKHLLALGIPKPSTFSGEDEKFLKSCGFRIIEV